MFRRALQRRLRDELLKETLSVSLAHARIALAAWRDDYSPRGRHAPEMERVKRRPTIASAAVTIVTNVFLGMR